MIYQNYTILKHFIIIIPKIKGISGILKDSDELFCLSFLEQTDLKIYVLSDRRLLGFGIFQAVT